MAFAGPGCTPSRVPPLPFPPSPQRPPVQRRKALARHPRRKLHLSSCFDRGHLPVLCRSCLALAEIPGPRRPGALLEYLRHEPCGLQRPFPAGPRRRAAPPAPHFPQGQNSARRYLWHLRLETHSRRRAPLSSLPLVFSSSSPPVTRPLKAPPRPLRKAPGRRALRFPSSPYLPSLRWSICASMAPL